MLSNSAYSDNLVTVTLFPCPEGVTVSGDLCICFTGKYLLTVTRFAFPEGVTVTRDVNNTYGENTAEKLVNQC